MKKILQLLVFVLLINFAKGQTFTNSTAAVIPDNGTSFLTVPLSVTGVGLIDGTTIGLKSVCVNLTHARDGHLQIYLEGPNGVQLPLSIDNGGTGVNYTNTCFTMSAPTFIYNGTPPFTGNFKPEVPLGWFNCGINANGVWKIIIFDDTPGFAGNFISGNITFSNTPAPYPVPSCNGNLGANQFCEMATQICTFNGYCGSTSDTYQPNFTTALETAFDNCISGGLGTSSIDNNSFIKFIASTSTVTLNVLVTGQPDGIQFFMYGSSNCLSGPFTNVSCNQFITQAAPHVFTATGLTPGNTYYLMVDGFNGAVCNYTITAVSGVSVLNVTPSAPTICAGVPVSLTATGGTTYTWTPATGLNTTTGATVIATPTANTTYTVSSTTAAGCPATRNVTVTVSPAGAAPNTNFTYPTLICTNTASVSPIPATGFTTGGTYSSTVGLSINPTTGVINGTASTSGTYNVIYTVPATGCNAAGVSTPVPVTITSASALTGTFSYSSPICNNSTSPPIFFSGGFTIGGTYTSTPAGLSISSTTGIINPILSTPNSYTVTYNIPANGCVAAFSTTAPVTISSSTTAITNFSYTTPICYAATTASPILPTGFTTGGTFTAPTGVVINPTTGVINPAASTTGPFTITYSVPASACRAASSSTFNINISFNTPITNFSYSSLICTGSTSSSPTLNTGFTTGGVFTASPAGLSINATTGVINANSSTPGDYTINYSVPVNATTCTIAGNSNAPTVTISASVTPTTSFFYPSPACNTLTSVSPTAVTGFTSGGTYNANPAGLSINATTGIINPSTSTAGSYTVTYSVPANGCNPAGSSAPIPIIITSLFTPNTNFSYTSPACVSATSLSPTPGTGFTTGGTYSSTIGLSISASTGVINPSISTPGTYNVLYTVAASGCNAAATSLPVNITIQALVIGVGGFSYASPVCAIITSASPIFATGFSTGGTFSSTPGITINPTTGVVNPSTSIPSGPYIIGYTLPASGCNAAVISTANISINASSVTVTNFTYPTSVCQNISVVNPNGASGFTAGGTYSSTTGLTLNATTGVITPTTSTAGTYTVTYAVAASSCNLASSSTFDIAITALSIPITSFSYTTPVCGNITSLTPTLLAGFVTGGTFSSTAGLTINTTTGVINASTSIPNMYTITYNVAASGCFNSGSSPYILTISPTTNPVLDFSYASPVCNSSTNENPILIAGFTTGGTYTAPTGVSINGITGSINPSLSTPGTYTITYSVPALGCRVAGSKPAIITISNSAAVVTTFSYPSPLCSNAGNTAPVLATGFTSGGTFASVPFGLNITAATGIVNPLISLPGIYAVTYTIPASACNPIVISLPFAVTVAPQLPPVITATPINYCLNKTATPLTAIGIPTATINWYTTATGGTALAAAPTPNTTSVGTTTYYVDQTRTGFCDAIRIPVIVNVNALPTANAGPDKVINLGESVVLNGTANGNNITYLWTPIFNSSTLTPTVSPLVNTAYELRVTSADGCIAFDSVKVNVVRPLKIPNVFSPNADNINDKWIIENLANYTDKRVEIFNRYGQSIFYSLDYTKPWDGTFKGKDLPVGVYFYIIKTTKNGIDDIYKGSITILR